MKKLWMMLLLMAFTLLLAGSVACGGDDDDDGGDSGGSDATATEAGEDGGDDPTDEPADDGDDDDGEDSDYYNELETIFDEADQATAAIGQQYGGPYDDTADEIEQTITAFEETGGILEEVAVSMSDLDVPADAQDEHDLYMASLGSAASNFSFAVSELELVSTAEELSAFQDERGPELSGAVDGIEENCLLLQELADAADSGADLGCSVQD